MNYLKQFVIQVAGMEPGLHQYTFDIDMTFFEEYGVSDIKKCSLHIRLDLIKQDDLITLEFHQTGYIGMICDRCLDPFDMPVESTDSIVLKYGQPTGTRLAEEDLIPPNLQELDVRQTLYDCICLQVPFRKVHPEDEDGQSGCDADVIRRIECLSANDQPDPRWDQLKNIQPE